MLIMSKSILKRLKKEQSPLIDGDIVTFVWQGEHAPLLVGDFTGWEAGNPIVMKKADPGLWTYRLTLPSDAYIEYAFFSDERNLNDPNNPRVSPNGMGGTNNYFSMPDYKPTTLAKKHRNIAHSTITRYDISTDYLITGRNRTIHLYQPPVKEPVPLMVVWDGQDYLHRAHLNEIVDNLIAQERIQPLALALVNNGGSKSRHLEYSCNDATLGFLMTEVLPLASKQVNLIDINAHPGVYGVAGASMGGLMALYTGTRIPQVFGNVLSQSGAFSWSGIDMVVFDLLEHGERRPLKIWMDVGIYDIPGLLESNRRMNNLLIQRGYQAKYREYHAGHNYPAWRDDIWRGLETLFGIEK
jgi:enterochelin esterase-like enzyme